MEQVYNPRYPVATIQGVRSREYARKSTECGGITARAFLPTAASGLVVPTASSATARTKNTGIPATNGKKLVLLRPSDSRLILAMMTDLVPSAEIVAAFPRETRARIALW